MIIIDYDDDYVSRYIQETLGLNELDPMYRQFARIFETFRISEPEKSEDPSKDQLQKEPVREPELKKVPKLEDEYEEEEEEEEVRNPLYVTE
jgi:splicing factor 3B subunit 2